jgi:uncharacterized membrane protein
VIGYALTILISLLNAFVHSRDAYTAVVPDGLTLSAIVVAVLLLTSWIGAALANRAHTGE